MVYQWINALTRTLQCKCLLCSNTLTLKDPNKSDIFGLCNICKYKLTLKQARCPRCALALALDEPICGQCLTAPPMFDKAISPTSYNSISKPLVHQCKNHQMSAIRCASELITKKLSQLPDVIISTPMHDKTWLKRGNNHSYLLARSLSKNLNVPFDSRSLSQHHLYDEQKHLNFNARRKNVKNAFSCKHHFDGMRVALVDDILTSMATANEITRTLKKAGADHVELWAITRTEKTM